MTNLEIHKKALQCVKQFNTSEIEMIDILRLVHERKVYRDFGYTSLYTYAVEALGIDANKVYILNSIAKKIALVPEFKKEIVSGEISISQARRIAKVLTPENKEHLFTSAKTLPQLELEREVAKINPKALRPDSLRVVTEESSEIRITIPKIYHGKMLRLQDVLSSKFKKHMSLEDIEKFIIDEALKHHDPLEKAKRNVNSSPSTSDLSQKPKSRYIQSSVKHKLQVRQESQCAYIHTNGTRCQSKRWLEYHHLTLYSHGGRHTEDNLTLLCHQHHKMQHFSSPLRKHRD